MGIQILSKSFSGAQRQKVSRYYSFLYDNSKRIARFYSQQDSLSGIIVSSHQPHILINSSYCLSDLLVITLNLQLSSA